MSPKPYTGAPLSRTGQGRTGTGDVSSRSSLWLAEEEGETPGLMTDQGPQVQTEHLNHTYLVADTGPGSMKSGRKMSRSLAEEGLPP